MVIKNRKKNSPLALYEQDQCWASIIFLLITINSKFQNISKSKNHQF